MFQSLSDYNVVDSGDGYIRFGSGIQICWGTQTFSNVAITTSWGNVYRSEDGAVQFDNFPVSFSSRPSVFFTGRLSGSSFWIAVDPASAGSSTGSSATSPGCVSLQRGTSSTISPEISYFAIGTWK